MIVGAVVYPQLRRWAVLVPGIYFASIVWVSVLVPNSTTTSELLLGAMLIVGMIVRPRGLLGTMPKEMPR
jgi:ABC-type branched-subunit amino acid transport system permease subunit